jgi:hypothetical protein
MYTTTRMADFSAFTLNNWTVEETQTVRTECEPLARAETSNELTTAQLNTIYDHINYRVVPDKRALGWDLVGREEFADLDTICAMSFSEFFEYVLKAFPVLENGRTFCDTCQVAFYESRAKSSGHITDVIIHVNNDGLEDGEQKKICSKCFDSKPFFKWRDDAYHNAPEPRICRYHGNDRDEFYEDVDFDDPTLLGLEIETFIPGNKRKIITVTESVQRQFPVLAEEDGSISRSNGVEFVFAPTSFDKLVNEESKLRKTVDFLRQNGVLGWDAGRGYGIHISINASKMSHLHCSKFCYFINRNNELCELVGGRPEGRWAEYLSRKLSAAGIVNSNKYQAAVRRSTDRIEVRIFRSSLCWSRIVRNCEFINSVREFTKMASTRELTRESYEQFLQSSTQKKRYKNIRDFLGLSKSKKKPSKETAMTYD